MSKSAKRKIKDAKKGKAPVATGAPPEAPARAPDDYSRPQAISTLQMVFPANLGPLLPPMKLIPEEFRDMNAHSKWHKFQESWFFFGLKDLKAIPKPGVDPAVAVRHLQALQGSFEPSTEHKRAAVAWLSSLWFEDVTYEEARPSPGK